MILARLRPAPRPSRTARRRGSVLTATSRAHAVRRALVVCTLSAFPHGLEAQRRETRLPSRPDAAPQAPRPRAASGVIEGFVSDSNLVPLRGAEVAVLRTSIRVVTEANGRFRFVDAPPGPYLLIVRRLGYRPVSAVVEVSTADTLRLSYMLERIHAVSALDTVRIVEQRASLRMLEFDQRRKTGIGEYLTQEQIDRQGKVLTADLLRFARTINVTQSHSRGPLTQYIAISRREGGSFIGSGAGACPMHVMVDGVPMPQGTDLNLLPPPKDLAGVEVYAGAATVPAQFGGADRRCGAILLWTRDR